MRREADMTDMWTVLETGFLLFGFVWVVIPALLAAFGVATVVRAHRQNWVRDADLIAFSERPIAPLGSRFDPI
jgi:hypothetical protein